MDTRSAQLDAILNSLPEAVVAVARDGNIWYQNLAASKWLGEISTRVEPELWSEYFGLYLDDGKTFFPGKSLPIVRALNDEDDTLEEMILRPPEDSNGYWINMSAQPIKDSGGEITGAIIIFQDISYRKQVELSREKHVRRAEALYKLSHAIGEAKNDLNQILNTVASYAAEYVGDACIVTLADGTEKLQIVAVYHRNQNANALLREFMLSAESDPQQDIIGGVISSGEPLLIPTTLPGTKDLFTQDEYAKYYEEIGVESLLVVPLKSQQKVLGTLRITRDRGGLPYTTDDQSLLLEIAHRTALAIENYHLFESLRQEIHDRKKAETAQVESEERFRSIFESSALGIILLDLEGRIIQINPAFQETIGYSEKDLIGHRFSEFIAVEDRVKFLQSLENLSKCVSASVRFESRVIRPHGGDISWVHATLAGIKSNDEDCFHFIVAMIENITDRKAMESELLETKARILSYVEAERLQLAQELHDGPLQDLHSVIFQIEGQRERAGTGNQPVLDEVQKAITRVIQDLRRTATELRPPTIASFGLEKAIRSHMEDFKEKHPELEIHLALASDRQFLPEEVRLALFRIYQQSVMNVIRHAEASKIDVRFTFDAEEIRLEIEDNGKGFNVPPRWISLLRQGHYGLAGSAERAGALNGRYEVSSRPGQGTLVRVTIPRIWDI